MGNNKNIRNNKGINLPIGKYYMSAYRHAINQYIDFLESTNVKN